jgi:hypothetical protein
MIETTETTMHFHDREKDSGIEGRKMETVFHGPQIHDLVRADLIEAPGMEMHFQDSEMVMHSPNPAETPGVAMAFRDRAEDSLAEAHETKHIHDRAQGPHEPIEEHTKTADRPA